MRLAASPPDRSTAVSDIVVIRSEAQTVDSPRFAAFVRGFVRDAEITALGRARTYLGDGGESLVRRTATRPSSRSPSSMTTKRGAGRQGRGRRRPRRSSPSRSRARDARPRLQPLSQEDLENGELKFGLPAALVVLLLVFGAVAAGLIPLLMAIVAIVVALGLTALLAQQFELSVFVINMLTGMGLALGIDYSLFVVSRYREERARGLVKLAAVEMSGATASRAVLFSGSVFVIAMFGMLLVPNSIMRSLAVGAILVGIVSVVAALTLLPAVWACSATGSTRCGSRSSVGGRSRRRIRRGASGARSCVAYSPDPDSASRSPPASSSSSPCPYSAWTPVRAASLRSPTASPPSRASWRFNATFPARPPSRPRSWSRTLPAQAYPRRWPSSEESRGRSALRSGEIARSGDGKVALLSVPPPGDPPPRRRPMPCTSSATRSSRRPSRELIPTRSWAERARRTSTTSTPSSIRPRL